MDTPRQQLAAQIQADNPAWLVHDFPTIPKQVRKGKPVVSVWRSDVAKEGVQHLKHELTIHLYGAKVIGVEAENELDDHLDGLLLSLERYKGCQLVRAIRRNFADDAFAGFEVTATVYSPNIYRSTVIQERSNNGSAAA